MLKREDLGNTPVPEVLELIRTAAMELAKGRPVQPETELPPFVIDEPWARSLSNRSTADWKVIYTPTSEETAFFDAELGTTAYGRKLKLLPFWRTPTGVFLCLQDDLNPLPGNHFYPSLQLDWGSLGIELLFVRGYGRRRIEFAVHCIDFLGQSEPRRTVRLKRRDLGFAPVPELLELLRTAAVELANDRPFPIYTNSPSSPSGCAEGL
jgi:hypothetical protein